MAHVDNFRRTIRTLREHDVAWRNVVVEVTLLVDVSQTLYDLFENLQGLVHRQFPLPLDLVSQQLTAEIVGDDILTLPDLLIVQLTTLYKRDDVLVLQIAD